jgi:hypothetical protein
MTEAELRALYGPPQPLAAAKSIARLDHHCRAFIAGSPLLFLATTGPGGLDVSPKGDAPGFVRVEDDHHLLIPDRPGNARIDGLVNLARDPRIALIFLIPGVGETLRVNGRGEVLADPALTGLFAVNRRLPVTVTRVAVEEAFIHCGKAFMRSELWDPATWPAARPVPLLGAMIADHAETEAPFKTEAQVEKVYRDTLY